MALYIVEKMVQDVFILALRGRLTLGEETEALRKKIAQVVDSGNTRMVLDLAEVSYIDSVGLSTLVASYTTVRKRGGDVKLLHLMGRIRNLMQITRLSTVFEIYDQLDAALKSFPREASA